MPYYTQNMVRFLREQERLAKLYKLNPTEYARAQRKQQQKAGDTSEISDSSVKPSYSLSNIGSKTGASNNDADQSLSGNEISHESKISVPDVSGQSDAASLINNCESREERSASSKAPGTEVASKSQTKNGESVPALSTDEKRQPCDKNENNNADKIMRLTPSCVDGDATCGAKKFEEEIKKENKKLQYDTKRLSFLQNMLRLMVERIPKCEEPKPFDKIGEKVCIDWGSRLKQIKSNRCTYYKAKPAKHNTDNAELVCKVIENYKTVIQNDNYVKILRHLGKKHPYIIQTWEIFQDANGTLIVVQEYAPFGDMNAYLRNGNIVNEEFIHTWSRQLFNAMDYLGDMGVCHRSLRPKHILIYHKNSEIRLTGFYNAIIYWDPVNHDIQAQPCKCFENRPRDHADFQAPEVYGNSPKEYFDPVQADMWSVGAVLFYALTTCYPFDYSIDNPKIEDEIQNKVKEITGISEECRQFFSEILTTNVPHRLHFDKLYKHDFFVKIKFARRNMLTSSKPDQVKNRKK